MKIIEGIRSSLMAADIPVVRKRCAGSLVVPVAVSGDQRIITIFIDEDDGMVRIECSLPFQIRRARQSKVAQLIGYINAGMEGSAMEILHDVGIVHVRAEVCIGAEWEPSKLVTIYQAFLAVDSASVAHFERVMMAALSEKPIEELLEWVGGNSSSLVMPLVTMSVMIDKQEEDEEGDDWQDPLFEFSEDDLRDLHEDDIPDEEGEDPEDSNDNG